jgi:hypothetical protein
MGTGKRYPTELRERAVRLVEESRSDHESAWAAISSVASKMGLYARDVPAELDGKSRHYMMWSSFSTTTHSHGFEMLLRHRFSTSRKSRLSTSIGRTLTSIWTWSEYDTLNAFHVLPRLEAGGSIFSGKHRRSPGNRDITGMILLI